MGVSEKSQAEWVALLGRQDRPTDAVREYCGFLAGSLALRGVRVSMHEVEWFERGWILALFNLWKTSRAWKGRWVLVQYTALSWSRRGFPFTAIVIVTMLQLRKVRSAVVFHDWKGYAGVRLIDRIRLACQIFTMRRIASLADRSIFPVPLHIVPWLHGVKSRPAFIPVGALLDLPATDEDSNADNRRPERGCPSKTVSVYVVTEGPRGVVEAKMIGSAVAKVAKRHPGLRLVVMGRGSRESRPSFEQVLQGTGAQLSVLGVLPAKDVSRALCRSDALLFVRGELEGQRSSAIAGIACGVPVIGYGEPQRAFPLSEAGVIFVPVGDSDALAEAIERVFSDEKFKKELKERNRSALAEYFSWDRIGVRFLEALADD